VRRSGISQPENNDAALLAFRECGDFSEVEIKRQYDPVLGHRFPENFSVR
jgi:hypothetical protein